MDIDPSLSARGNLLALIKRDYGLDLDDQQVTFELPRAYYDPSGRNLRNTEVLSRFRSSTGKLDSITFKYWRVELYQYDKLTVDITGSFFTTVAEFKAAVCEKLGLIADEILLVDQLLPNFTLEEPTQTFTFSAKIGSYVYRGVFDLNVTMDVRIDLINCLGDGILDGFEPDNVLRDENGVPIMTPSDQYIWA